MRVFLDTNVLVSALATRGLCAELYERLLTEHEVVIGEPVVAEVLDIIRDTGALEFTRRQALHEAEAACASIATFTDSKHKQCLLELAHFAATRQF